MCVTLMYVCMMLRRKGDTLSCWHSDRMSDGVEICGCRMGCTAPASSRKRPHSEVQDDLELTYPHPHHNHHDSDDNVVGIMAGLSLTA